MSFGLLILTAGFGAPKADTLLIGAQGPEARNPEERLVLISNTNVSQEEVDSDYAFPDPDYNPYMEEGEGKEERKERPSGRSDMPVQPQLMYPMSPPMYPVPGPYYSYPGLTYPGLGGSGGWGQPGYGPWGGGYPFPYGGLGY